MPKAIRARTMNNTMMMIAMTSFSLTIVAVYLVDWEMRRGGRRNVVARYETSGLGIL